MDRIAVALIIAVAALVMTFGIGKGVLAREAAPVAAPPAQSQAVGHGTRVLSLLLTLQALRTAPAPLDSPKV